MWSLGPVLQHPLEINLKSQQFLFWQRVLRSQFCKQKKKRPPKTDSLNEQPELYMSLKQSKHEQLFLAVSRNLTEDLFFSLILLQRNVQPKLI